MTAPAVSTASPTAPSATEFEQDIGHMFGDYSTAGEPPEPDASAAGTTPAEPAEGTVDGASQPAEPKAGADAAETPSEGTTPDAAEPVVEDDPFKDTTPAQYVVNGQQIPVEDIRVFKEGGAVIRPESLPNVLSKLAERDTLAERVRSRDAEYQTLAKATEWSDQSSGKTYSGPEAAIEMRIGNASLFAENQLIVQAITDPDILARCLTTAKGADGVERVVFSEHALNDLKREVSLRQRELAGQIRDHYKTVVAEASKPAPAPLDYPKVTDALIADLSKAASLDASVLTAQDRALLAEQLPFHVKDGEASLAWQKLVKAQIEVRASQKQAVTKLVPTITDATKKGLNNMAAAARGVRTPVRPVTPAPKAPTPQSERATSEAELFDNLLTSGAAALRAQR